MKKGMMKHISKLCSYVVIVALLIGIHTMPVLATSFSVTSNKPTVAPNGTFKVTISADGAGKFEVAASNATVSDKEVWVDGSSSVNVTAASGGTVKITVTALDAYDWNENPITGKKSVEVAIVKPSTQLSDGENGESALTVQLAIAEKLKRTNYTDETWNVLNDAIKAAKKAEKSNDPELIGQAALDLKYAIDSLVEIDHVQLQSVIDRAKQLVESSNADLLSELTTVLDTYEGMLYSTSQQEVDIATDKILHVVEKLESELGNSEKGPMNIWVILFVVSLVVNLGIGYVLVGKSKRRFNDDIPVVDYDIDDDNL